MLKIFGIVLSVALAALAILLFNLHTQEKFKFKFFSMRMFTLLAIALLLWMAGTAVRAQGGEDADLPGYLLIGAACVVFWWVITLNLTQTNLLYFVIGTAGQFTLFSIFAYAGIFSAIILGGALIAVMSLFKPVFVVNQNRCDKPTS